MTVEIQYDRNRRVITPPPVIVEDKPEVQTSPVQEVEATLDNLSEQEVVDVHQGQEPEEPQEDLSENDIEYQKKEAQRIKDEISKEKSLAALRKRAEEAEQIRLERDEYARMVKELKAKQEQLEDAEIGIDDNDLAEGKHIKKLSKEVQRLRKEAEEYKQQSYLANVENRIRSKYPDFDAIVNQDTIIALRELEPEVASSINANTDLYAKAVSAYTMIKKLGIGQHESYSAEKDRIAKNMTKPRALTSSTAQRGDSPLSQANRFAEGLTPALRAQLIKEMKEATRNM